MGLFEAFAHEFTNADNSTVTIGEQVNDSCADRMIINLMVPSLLAWSYLDESKPIAYLSELPKCALKVASRADSY